MNLIDFRTELRRLLGATSTGLSDATATLWANKRQAAICKIRGWRFLEKKARLLLPVTTVATAAVAGATALVLTSAANLGRNRWLIIANGSSTEEPQISSITSNTLTLTSATALEHAQGAGIYVQPRDLFLPHDCGRICTLSDWENDRRIDPVARLPFDNRKPRRNVSGSVPLSYAHSGRCVDKEPSTGSYTADASTDTDTIVDSALTAASDDYYAGWLAINHARKASARVLSYTASTKTLELETAIASQASGDVYHLEPQLNQIEIYPCMTASFYFRLRYWKAPPLLVNDWDELTLPEPHDQVLLFDTAKILAATGRRDPTAQTDTKFFNELYNEAMNKLIQDQGTPSSDFQEHMVRESSRWDTTSGRV